MKSIRLAIRVSNSSSLTSAGVGRGGSETVTCLSAIIYPRLTVGVYSLKAESTGLMEFTQFSLPVFLEPTKRPVDSTNMNHSILFGIRNAGGIAASIGRSRLLTVSAEMHFFIRATCPPCRSVHFIGVLPLACSATIGTPTSRLTYVAY